jgi:4,5-dihydroxyphthalate decarboxylase
VPLEKGKTLEDELASGALPAAIGVQIDAPDVKPLIPNPREAGFEALRQRGLYPINHTVVVKNDLLREHRDLAADIYDAFSEARRLYVARLTAGIEQPSADDVFFRKVMDVTGDPLPYGVEPNRAMIEAVIRHSVEQGILARPLSVEELFPEI